MLLSPARGCGCSLPYPKVVKIYGKKSHVTFPAQNWDVCPELGKDISPGSSSPGDTV